MKLLRGPFRERVGTRAVQVDADLVGESTDHVERRAEIGHRLTGGVADPGHELHRVAEQFLVDLSGPVDAACGDQLEEVGCGVRQIAGVPIDEREFPFDAECRFW